MKPNVLLVERLRPMWDPMEAIGFTPDLSQIEQVEPLLMFRERRGPVYHRRRIRYFMDCLRRGQELEPINVDNFCEGGCIYPTPIVLDGNHRFIAVILMKQETIEADYGGRVDLLRYLEGKRRNPPL